MTQSSHAHKRSLSRATSPMTHFLSPQPTLVPSVSVTFAPSASSASFAASSKLQRRCFHARHRRPDRDPPAPCGTFSWASRLAPFLATELKAPMSHSEGIVRIVDCSSYSLRALDPPEFRSRASAPRGASATVLGIEHVTIPNLRLLFLFVDDVPAI